MIKMEVAVNWISMDFTYFIVFCPGAHTVVQLKAAFPMYCTFRESIAIYY